MGRLLGRRRSVEATSKVATGTASLVDGESGWRRLGEQPMELPVLTLERARAASVHLYRANPLARAIIDTYSAFCVGDSGVSVQSPNRRVQEVLDQFWKSPRNRLGVTQRLFLQDHLLLGETVWELLVGPVSATVEIAPRSPTAIKSVSFEAGNPLWPDRVVLPGSGGDVSLRVQRADRLSGLRDGDCVFIRSGQALVTDQRGAPFLMSVADQLEAYDTVLSNLIDRTTLARYVAFDVTVTGADQTALDEWVRARGGRTAPPSGSIEVHNENVTWKTISADSGADEDTQTLSALMTNVAAGPGLAKTWLADPDGANRATSVSMAEPVRRRVGGIQELWLGEMAEVCRFAVDRAVAVGRLPGRVKGANGQMVPAAESVSVRGPEIAAADAQVNATVLYNLGQALDTMVARGVLSVEAARVAAEKAWEQFTGEPWRADLDVRSADVDQLAEEMEAVR